MAIVVERDVLGERELEHEAAPLAVLGDVPDAGVETCRASGRWSRPRRRSRPCRPSCAGDRSIASISSLWPLPSTPASPTISPARTSNDTPRTASSPRSSLDAQVLDLEQRLARLGRRASRPGAAPRGRPSARASPASVAPSRGTVSIIFPRRSTVIRSAISSTSFSLWLMKMIDMPCPRQAADDLEQLLRLLRRQHGGRLVEDQDVGAAVERLQDLHPLLLADGDVLDLRGRVDREPERAARARAPAASRRRSRAGRRRSSARSASTMFSATVITGISMKCWCTMPIPASIASFGERIATACPLMQDLALVRPVEAVEDVHQRRLARPVLAEQRVHLAASQVEVDRGRWRRSRGSAW